MRKQETEQGAGGVLAPPRPDPRHPEGVLDTVPRAAGIDVHKMSLTCTVLVEDSNGRVESETRQYRTYGAELDLLVEWLSGLDLARTVMESTGVFWKSVQRALAASGVEVWVVNARHVKRVPGRKTDVSDSQWLATLARYGLVRPSFLAPPKLEELRRLTRLHARTRRLASMLRNMLHRVLDESGLRIGGILTDLFGLSGCNLLDGREPEQMVAGVKGKARKKIPALLDALGHGLDEGTKPLVVLLREMLAAVERSLAELERRILDVVGIICVSAHAPWREKRPDSLTFSDVGSLFGGRSGALRDWRRSEVVNTGLHADRI
jgi:transposase